MRSIPQGVAAAWPLRWPPAAPARWAALAWGLGLLLSLAAAGTQARRDDTRVAMEFNAIVEHYIQRVEQRFSIYEQGVRSVRGVVVAAGPDQITREQFRNYIDTRDHGREFPGALGFGYIRRVPPGTEAEFERAQRAGSRPDFAIHGFGPNTGERWVIDYIEPEAPNKPAIGLDVASDPVRREANLAAMRAGRAQLSGPITLLQAREHPFSAFLMVLACYRPGLPAATPAEREQATAGWAYAPLEINDVLQDIVRPADAIGLRLRDITDDTAAAPFFDAPIKVADALERSEAIDIYGRRWEIRVQASQAFVDRLHLSSPTGLGLSGLAGTTLLAVLVFVMGSAVDRRRQFRAEQEALAAGVLDSASQALVVVNAGGVIVRVNRGVKDLFGYRGDELVGKSVDLLLPEAQRERHAGLRRTYDHTPRPMGSRKELLARHASGRIFHVQVNLSPLQLNDQQFVVASVLDVTAEYEAHQRLAASEARWKELANSMPLLVWTSTPDGQCDFLSSQWVAYTGRTESGQLGLAWLEQVHPSDRPDTERRWRESVEARRPFQFEFRLRRHDGQYRWFNSRGVPLLDDSGQVLRWVGAVADVEDRRRAEDALRELNTTLEARVTERTALLDAAQRDLRNILDALPSMVGYWDREQRNRFANLAYHRWFGLDPASLPGKTLAELLGPTLYEKNRHYIEAALRGEPQSFEREIPSPEGPPKYSLALYLPDIVDGEVRGFYALVHDITDIRRAQAAAEAASQAKTSFLANMSHEIRTPMNAVINLTYLLENSALAPDQADLVGKIKVASRALLGLINDILDLSKIEAGEMAIAAEAFDLRSTVEDLATLMAGQASSKQVVLRTRIDPEVPAHVRGDRHRVDQILANLISNAIKFTDRGTVVIEVTRDLRPGHEARIRFEVADTGIGIEADAIDRLFEPFTQADESTTRRFGGTGLGLAIVRRLVDLMDGDLGVESRIGHGSRFWCSLPLPAVADAAPATLSPKPLAASVPTASAARRGASQRLRGIRILLVDDSSINLEVAQRILEREGAAVTPVGSGVRALDLLRAMPDGYDLVLMDVQMPQLDGHEATRRIRRELGLRHLPVIALTAGAMMTERERALAAGMNEFISKPFDAELVIATVLRLAAPRAAAPPPAADTGTGAGTGAEGDGIAPDWPELPGIDREAVAERLGNDVELFRSALQTVFADFGDLGPELEPGADEDRATVLADRVHKLRGICANLAAVSIQRLAGEIETALRSGRARPPLHAQLAELQSQLATLQRAAASFVAGAPAVVAPRPAAPIDELQLERLRRLLHQQSLDALDLFEQLQPALAAAMEPAALRHLAALIRQLRFAECLPLLATVRAAA